MFEVSLQTLLWGEPSGLRLDLPKLTCLAELFPKGSTLDRNSLGLGQNRQGGKAQKQWLLFISSVMKGVVIYSSRCAPDLARTVSSLLNAL